MMCLLDKLKSKAFRWEDSPVIPKFERELTRVSFCESPVLDEKFHKHKLEKPMKAEPNGLILLAEEYFLNKGVSRLNLIVSETSDKAVSFFREMGLEETHLTMKKTTCWRDIKHAQD